MTQWCIDGAPHFFTVYSGTKVFCQKCLETADFLIPDPIPPDPPDPIDPRPVVTFTAPTGDCTAQLQNWMNTQPSNAIWDILGVASINATGLQISGKTNVKLTSSNSGGFKAIGNGSYAPAYSSLLYAANTTDCSFENLRFDGNNKSAQALFVHRSTRPKILRCEAWNIQYIPGGGAPYAALKADVCTDAEIAYNNIHDLGGIDGGSGVRGIWAGVGSSEYSTRPHIHHNTITRPGHTGIVTESTAPIVTDNIVTAALIQGTGYKFIPRGPIADAIFDNNTVDGTAGSGIMFEGSGVFPAHIYVRGWKASNIGKAGTTFGFVYISGSAGTRNVEIRGNNLVNCKRLANVNYGWDLKFTDNVGTGNSILIALENECHNIVVTNSGSVEIGTNCSNIVVDGHVITKAPLPGKI